MRPIAGRTPAYKEMAQQHPQPTTAWQAGKGNLC